MNNSIKKTGANILGRFGIREKIIEPPGITTNEPIVFHAFLEKIEVINEKKKECNKIIPKKLIIDKGEYTFHGRTYHLDREGIYRFVLPGIENKQRIVFEKNTNALLSSIAWIFSHGSLDDKKSNEEIREKALYSKISATCGTISEWTVNLLRDNGIKARLVSSLTLESWNSYDNGHILIEVFRPELKKWVVYDIDNDAFFTHNNVPLSLIEFVENIPKDAFSIEYIARRNDIDVKNFLDDKSNYDYGFLIESRFLDDDTRRKWYRHIFQVPMIIDGKFSYYFDKDNSSKIQEYSSYYKYVDKNRFLERFYND
jgi:hypothetical protein